MSQNKGFASIALIIIALLVLGGGYWVWKKQAVAPPSALPEGEGTSTSPLGGGLEGVVPTNWKTYRNEKNGFEFKYPPEYKIDDSGSYFVQDFKSRPNPNRNGFSGVIINLGEYNWNKSFQVIIFRQDSVKPGRIVTSLEEFVVEEAGGLDPSQKTEINLGTEKGIRVKKTPLKSTPESIFSDEVFAFHDGIFFKVSSLSPGFPDPIYSRVLSTFRFIK